MRYWNPAAEEVNLYKAEALCVETARAKRAPQHGLTSGASHHSWIPQSPLRDT